MSPATTAAQGVRIKAVYAHLDAFLTGVERLKKAGFTGFEVTAPLPRHELLDVVYEGRPSPVRWWTLTGAVSGMTAGFCLTSLTHTSWPMINPGGKPTVAVVPFAVIMFECTILFGALATFVGMIVHAGLPGFFLDKALKDPRFTDASFGIVFTRASERDQDRIMDLLSASGAVEVTSGADTVYEVANDL